MRWRIFGEWLCLAAVCFVWGQLAARVAKVLFPHGVAAYLTLLFVLSFGGGCLLGYAWARLTRERRRRELYKLWGIEDQQP